MDDVLQALDKGYSYRANAALIARKHIYSTEREKVVKKLINAVQYYMNEITNYFFNMNAGCRVFRLSDYQCCVDIGYLNNTLHNYGMQPDEQIILQTILIEGLDKVVNDFPDEYVSTQIADLIYDSDYDFPAKYVDLLSDWKRLRYDWQQHGITKQQVWQQLIDIGMLDEDVVLQPDENNYFDDDLLPALADSNNLMVTDHKPETLFDVFMEMTESFLDGTIRWLDEKDIAVIPLDSWIQLNTPIESTSTDIEPWDFEYMGKYYHCIFDHSYADDFTAVIRVFNTFLQLFKPELAIYHLPTDNEPILFFTTHQKKFDALNQRLKIPVLL